jgi:hypothetical protein
MKIKAENGIVTFIMKAGKDKVRSSMSLAEANRIVSSGKDVAETATEVIVNDTYFFPIEPEKKSRKKNKADEVSENE